MKLYYATGTCSLVPHIVALEAGLKLDSEKVDISSHETEDGADYTQMNPKAYVPALQLDDGQLLTEIAAIVQYNADQAPRSNLAPAAGSMERYRLQEWLNFISAELHKVFSPWFFRPDTSEITKQTAKGMIAKRFDYLDRHLAQNDYLMGESFAAADAYCFTITEWSKLFNIDLAPHPNFKDYIGRIGKRPKVREAMQVEGLP